MMANYSKNGNKLSSRTRQRKRDLKFNFRRKSEASQKSFIFPPVWPGTEKESGPSLEALPFSSSGLELRSTLNTPRKHHDSLVGRLGNQQRMLGRE